MTTDMSRRLFLLTGLTVPIGLMLSCSRSPLKGLDNPISRAKPALANSSKYVFSPSGFPSGSNTICSILDLTTQEIFQIDIPLTQAHSAVFHPEDPDIAIIFDTLGPLACEVSISKRKCSRTFSPTAGNYFGGHGVFLSPEIFISSEVKQGAEGRIIGRDFRTLTTVFDYASGGYSPHQIGLSADNKYIVAANEGVKGKIDPHGYSNISKIDVNNGKILEKISSENFSEKFRHFTLAKSGNICIAAKIIEMDKSFSISHLNELYKEHKFKEQYDYQNKMTHYMPTPAIFIPGNQVVAEYATPSEDLFIKMRDTNSICEDETRNIICLSHSLGNILSFWDANKKQPIHTTQTDFAPRGIVFDSTRDCYFVHTIDQKIHRIDGKTLEPTKITSGSFLGSAHLTVA